MAAGLRERACRSDAEAPGDRVSKKALKLGMGEGFDVMAVGQEADSARPVLLDPAGRRLAVPRVALGQQGDAVPVVFEEVLLVSCRRKEGLPRVILPQPFYGLNGG